jgi:hypothetical protein
MNWGWVNSLDQIWRSSAFPMWLTLTAAAFFGVIALMTLLRAEKSVANGALTIITLLSVGVAVAATIPGFGMQGSAISDTGNVSSTLTAQAPLACLDDLAGEAVLNACEKALFGSAEQTAAAVSYAASQISRLTAFADVAAADKNITPELQALRHAVEHDRYGLIAYVLKTRDHCTPTDCVAFRAVNDRRRIAANMEERSYEALISRYAPVWNAPPSTASVPVAALVSGIPTGKPTNAEFPSAASTPPVSIMTPEPGAVTPSPARATPATAATPPLPSPRPSSAASPALAAAKKQPAPKPASTPAPAPAPTATAAPAPAASNE